MADWMKGFENQGTRYTIQINHKADQKWSAFGVFRPKSQAVVWFAVQKGMPRNDPGRLPKTHKADQKWSAFGLFLLCKIITK